MTTLWVAITALAMVAAWNFGAILRLQRRIERLIWLNTDDPPQQLRTRWPPSTGWTAADELGRNAELGIGRGQERKP